MNQAWGLEPNARVSTEFGRELRVVSDLGRGGQGIVYKVLCNGREMALKWYDPNALPRDSHVRDKFKQNLKDNVIHGSPSADFLWPLDLTVEMKGTFGYLMDLAPEGFKELNRLLLDPEAFKSERRAVDVCLGVASAINMLHKDGYRYQDLKEDNIFANPLTGKTLICDCDNATPEGGSTGIAGTVGFMAPEIMVATDPLAGVVPNPTIQSDLYSMAVTIFDVLVLQHPLQGRRFAEVPQSLKGQRYVYGTHPLFIFDEDDSSNRPVQSPESNALLRWPLLPTHIQEFLKQAFSQTALLMPGKRPLECVWMRQLARLRSEIVRCRCGNEVFLDGDTLTRRCEQCGAWCGASLYLELPVGQSPDNRVPVINDARLYRCQLELACNVGTELEPQLWAQASRSNPNDIALRNMSQVPWEASLDGRTVQVLPGRVVRALEGMELRMMGKSVFIRRNQ